MHSGTGTGAGTGRLLLWRWGLLAWLLAVGVSGSSAAEMVCDAADGSCASMPTPEDDGRQDFEVIIQNDSKYRADIYWDDGRFGTFLATVELGGQQGLNVFPEHELFVTRHGVRENLFVDDVPVKFSAKKPTRFRIPSSAAPSDNPCQDRYGICEAEARRGSCSTTPGWMIVHCCKACDPYIESSRLIDPKIRCSQEHLNMTGPVWKPGDLNKLFEEWYVTTLAPTTRDGARPHPLTTFFSFQGHVTRIPKIHSSSLVKSRWKLLRTRRRRHRSFRTLGHDF